MAQRIIGLDLGAYSLKAVHVDSTFRGFQLVDYKERRVALGPQEMEGSSADLEAIESWLEGEPTGPETVICAIPGDFVLTRFLTMPFRDRKRIAEVIGFELEDHIPYDIDEVVYDYQIIDQTDDSSKVLVVAVPRERLDPFLKDLKEVGIDPKVLSFGPWAYVNLVPFLQHGAQETIAVIDIGHKRTDVCIVREGTVEFVRTLNRAGAHLNEAIAKRLDIDVHEADIRKRMGGRVPLDGPPPVPVPAHLGAYAQEDETVQLRAISEDGPLAEEAQAMSEAIGEAVVDILRDVRLALVAHQTQVGRAVDRIYACGGTAQLEGLLPYFERRLGVPVEALDAAHLEFNRMSDPEDGAAIIPKGLALSLRGLGAGAVSEINLRRGPYAFVGEFRFLRDRLTAIVLMVLALLSIAGFRAYTRFESLSAQRESQIQELRRISKDLIGREIDDFEGLVGRLSATPDEQESPFPEVDAFDLFFDISGAIEEVKDTPRVAAKEAGDSADEKEKEKPPEAEVKPAGVGEDDEEDEAPAEASSDRPPDDRYIIELETVRIEKQNGTLKGQANDIEAYELFLQKLKAHRCLRKVETQTTELVTFQRHTGWRDFQLKFNIDCSPRKVSKSAKKKPVAAEAEAKPDKPTETEGE